MNETANLALPLNGKRYLPEMGGAIHLEHLHRYLVARELIAGRDVLDVACGERYATHQRPKPSLCFAAIRPCRP